MAATTKMEREYITPAMHKECGLCDKPIKDEYRLRITFGDNAYIVCHEKCLKNAYNILLINQI